MDHNDDDESGDDEICFVAVVVGGGLRVSRMAPLPQVRRRKILFQQKGRELSDMTQPLTKRACDTFYSLGSRPTSGKRLTLALRTRKESS